jgi:hypothetical protein
MNRKTLLGAVLALAAAASAETLPQRINFQGKLINPTTNNPEAGPVDLTFNIYNVASGGSSLYTETQNGVPLTNGVFSVEIGTVTALSRDLFLGASVYLGVTVVGDAGGEMVPRQNLVMSAYAFTANQLSDQNEVRLIAGAIYSTFTSAGNFTAPGGIVGSSGSFTNGITASSGTFLGGALSVGGSSFTVAGGSATVAYSMTATAFYGDGTNLTNVVNNSGDTMTGQLTISGASETVTGAVGIGAASLANGTLVVQSTSAVAANPVISGRNSAGTEMFRLQDDGTLSHGPAGLVSTFTNTGDLRIPYGFYAGSATFTSGVTASSGTFTATGGSQYSLTTSSGINMNAGTLDITGTAGMTATDTGIMASTITVMQGLYMSTSTLGCTTAGCGSAVVVWLKNAKGASVPAGSIVTGSSPLSFTTIGTAETQTVLGVVFGAACNTGLICPIAISGVVWTLATAAVTVGDCVVTGGTAGEAESVSCGSAAATESMIGRWLSTGGGAGVAEPALLFQ